MRENNTDYKRSAKGRISDWFYSIRIKFGSDKKPSSKKSHKHKKKIFLIVMLAIPIVHWLIFWLGVNITSILLAFKLPVGGWSLNNFRIFWDDLTTRGLTLNIAIKNTMLYFANNLIVIFPGALIISYFIFKKIRFYRFFRVVFFLPAIISQVALTGVFKEFIKPWGPLGVIVKALGGALPATGLLGTPQTATITIIIYCIWTGFSGNILLFGGAMTRIPIDVFEAAKIEGCGPFREVVSIILPLIWPTISTMIVFTMTGLFTASGPILLFTNGEYETTTIAFWIFDNVYSGGVGQYNIISAAGLCFTLVGVPIILLVRYLLDKIPAVEY